MCTVLHSHLPTIPSQQVLTLTCNYEHFSSTYDVQARLPDAVTLLYALFGCALRCAYA
jgi:hypothetical protein